MIPVPSGSRVWLATGHTDLRRDFDALAALVQDHLHRDPFSCRSCESVVQTPALHHAIARGRAGPGLPAHIAVAKFDDHLPLYRQAEI